MVSERLTVQEARLSTTASAAAAAKTDRAFFGHPKGLGFLAFTEGWVGFSYYGMQSLLVLYMTSYLLQPGHIEHIVGFGAFRAAIAPLYGHVSGQALASAITALYGAIAYAMPLLGGVIADRLIGRTASIIAGSVLMTVGHFLMAFDVSFLAALLCLVTGTGLAGTLKAQVGGLYAPGDLRRGDAFQIYSLAVQIAVIGAPIVCGTLGEKVAWHWGFGAAGVGMAIGLAVYVSGLRWMPPDPALRKAEKLDRPKMTAREWRTVGLLLVLLPILAVAFVGNNEIFNAYLLWGKANFQLEFFGQTMPVSWLLSMDAFVSTGTTLFVIAFWRWWATRWKEPDEIVKVGAFGLIAALGPLVLAAASLHAAGGHKVGLAWGLGFHIVNDIGFSGMYPIGMALFSRAAPPALGATIVNAYVFSIFLCNLLVGKLAGMLSTMSGAAFWGMHAALVAIAAVMLLVCARLFGRSLAPQTEADR
jgi:POT family proton-dependent oligopeptide transporter